MRKSEAKERLNKFLEDRLELPSFIGNIGNEVLDFLTDELGMKPESIGVNTYGGQDYDTYKWEKE